MIKSSIDNNKSETWTGKLDFILAVMGYNIGLGNLLRFPYLVMRNGGGSFLVAYFFFLLTIGVPLFVIELSLGQYSGKTPIKFWENISPLFKGIGWTNVLFCGIFNIYYNVMMSWIIYYMAYSFSPKLQWYSCNNSWNSKLCHEPVIFNATNEAFLSSEIYDDLCSSNISTITPSEEFWEHNVLNITEGINHLGNVRWHLCLCLIMAWLLTYLCLIKGIQSLGKVVYVTALAPYVLLLILLIRGCMLPGGFYGIKYYLSTDWKRLLDTQVWLEAAQQIFWSLAPAWGGTITMASHNKFTNNIYRDGIMLPILSSMTSLFGGLVTFSYIGNMAKNMGKNISCVMKAGPGLAFIVYPDAMKHLMIPQIWSVLFFLLLLFLGLDSAFTSFETIYQSLADKFPKYLKYRASIGKLCLCLVSFLLGLPMITQGGHYVYQLVDWYQTTFLMFVALAEVLCIGYIYGTGRLKSDIYRMTGVTMTILWDIIIRGILPLILLVMCIMTLIDYPVISYGKYHYPKAAIIIGWLFAACLCAPLPIFCIIMLSTACYKSQFYLFWNSENRKNFKMMLKTMCESTKEWTSYEEITVRCALIPRSWDTTETTTGDSLCLPCQRRKSCLVNADHSINIASADGNICKQKRVSKSKQISFDDNTTFSLFTVNKMQDNSELQSVNTKL